MYVKSEGKVRTLNI